MSETEQRNSRTPATKPERWGNALENTLLVLLLGVMMVLACGQIVLRIFFDSGIIWADEFLRILVLWIALIGAVAAARSRRHIRIDVLSQFVPPRYARLPALAANAFAAIVCGLIAWFSCRYVLLTIESGDTVLIGVPSWTVQGILPVAFALMCYRYLFDFVTGALGLIRGLFGQAPTE